MTIGEIISRIRTANKLQNADARISDRVIYNQMVTSRDLFIKNEQDKKALSKISSMFKPLNYVELIEVDTIDACGIDSDCMIRRSKDKLPNIVKGAGGEIIKSITSLDGEEELQPTTRKSFGQKLGLDTWKFDKHFYYFLEDNYLYAPNIDWDAVRILAIFEDPNEIDKLNACFTGEKSACLAIKDREFLCPSYLIKAVVDSTEVEIMNYYNRLKEDFFINKNPNQ